jgi:hypothetical protein
MKRRSSALIATAVFGVTLLAIALIEFELSGPCRLLTSISSDSDMNRLVREELARVLAEPETESRLRRSAGTVFNVKDSDSRFLQQNLPEGLSVEHLRLVVRSDRADRGFSGRFRIQEVGVEYGRSYLVFPNRALVSNYGDEFQVSLGDKSNVTCDD